jgi:nicotinamide-nucleotide amidase
MTVGPAQLHAAMLAHGVTVAVAESLTGGLLAAALTETPGSSATMRGGLVVYATDLKATLAGVDRGLLARRGAVDPDVARELAEGVRQRLGATFGIGVSGVAGPDAQDGVTVGTVYAAVAGERTDVVEQWIFDGDRGQIRRAAVQGCLDLLDSALRAEFGGDI